MSDEAIMLAACPCGVTPKELCIADAGQGMKWAFVCGDCCGEWSIEFRTGYNKAALKAEIARMKEDSCPT